MTDTATDKRPRVFIIEYAAIEEYDLTPGEGWVYVRILSYVNQQQGVAFPSVSTLAEKCKMSEPTVRKHLKALAAKGLIAIEHRTKKDKHESDTNHYHVLPATKPDSTNWVKAKPKPEKKPKEQPVGGQIIYPRGKNIYPQVGKSFTPNSIELNNTNQQGGKKRKQRGVPVATLHDLIRAYADAKGDAINDGYLAEKEHFALRLIEKLPSITPELVKLVTLAQLPKPRSGEYLFSYLLDDAPTYMAEQAKLKRQREKSRKQTDAINQQAAAVLRIVQGGHNDDTTATDAA